MAIPQPKEGKKDRNKKRVMQYLERYISENGYAPSVRDICAALNFRSTSTVHQYLKDLQDEGSITYADGKRRAISVLDSMTEEREEAMPVLSWPLLGMVTAGQPILAQENVEYNIAIDEKLFPHSNDGKFLLRVRGDSMMDAGIFGGDLIIVTPSQSADRNEIVVALIGEEATVKRFGYQDGVPYLFPENEAFAPIPFNSEDCHIIGKVVGLIRTRI